MSLGSRLRGRVTVVGIGNPLRGDDGVGCWIARALEDERARGVWVPRGTLRVLDAEEVPESYVGPVVASRPDVVLLVDAVDLGAEPGSMAVLEGADLSATGPFTHRTPLGLLAWFLRRVTGADVLLLAVQPVSLEWGEGLSAPVAATALSVTALLREALSC